ncbi:hypothetical protein GCM10025864_18070 [Luteimicrobium album]|uniref:DUF2332 domain-containing protein n=1 Tax=Luteimicrobium album TaxID=1054550 RepID=A0ABQ6I1L7_9MICO|nr:DUF2332 domain-containing protein [Luteimicrobium album]GMA24048.1 hypothetical protein GCM10025864_18070 [Luteimicrobium album]
MGRPRGVWVLTLYDDWARSIAADDHVRELVEALPAGKRQPNLVFAAARMVGIPLAPYEQVRDWFVERWGALATVALERATQTNEAARCAVLLQALAKLDGPLALVEVGASAGLCLYPDRYSYRYRSPGATIALDPPDGPSSVVIDCAVDDPAQIPATLPQVVWRAGIDLNPLDVTDPDDVAWLQTLIWPEHDDRRERLRAACAIAALDPPHLVRGDLLNDLDPLLDDRPADAHLVVFHSAVLVYVDPSSRERFIARMRSLDGTWVANEGAGVLPSSSGLPHDGRTVLSIDDVPVARTHPHGRSITHL